MQPQPQPPTTLSPRTIKNGAIALFCIIVIILIVITLQQIFHKNPYGEEIKINNFTEYYPQVPRDRRDAVFSSLHDMIASNSKPDAIIPKSGAIIRENTAQSNYNEDLQNYYGSFIVDIAEIQQSYNVQFAWTEDRKAVLYGDSMLITCVHGDKVIYNNFVCTDAVIEQENETNDILERFPIMKVLPIDIEYYADGYGAYTHYTISSDFGYNEDKSKQTFSVLITDYTGGNYDDAIQRITNLGYNPKDYNIIYQDYSEETGRPPES